MIFSTGTRNDLDVGGAHETPDLIEGAFVELARKGSTLERDHPDSHQVAREPVRSGGDGAATTQHQR
jgi:hypothetical protein